VCLDYKTSMLAFWSDFFHFYKTISSAFYGLHIRRIGHNPSRRHSADRWVLPTANAAETNGLTCLPKHGGAREYIFGHLFSDQPVFIVGNEFTYSPILFLSTWMLRKKQHGNMWDSFGLEPRLLTKPLCIPFYRRACRSPRCGETTAYVLGAIQWATSANIA
jgi:hypothetical protein